MRWHDLPLLFSIAGMILATSLAVHADEAEERLDQLLQRLKLSDLRLRHFEQELTRQSDAAQVKTQAARLSDMYAQRLLESGGEPETFAKYLTRAKELLREHPDLETPILKVMLLQAEYQQAESLALTWIDDPRQAMAKSTATEQFAHVEKQLRAIIVAQNEVLDKEMTKLDAAANVRSAKPTNVNETAQSKLDQIQLTLSRAQFFAGWSSYFQGLLNADANSPAQWTAAANDFAQILEISADLDEVDFEPDTLGLRSSWRARAMLGYSVCAAALGKTKLAQGSFDLLAREGPASIASGIGFWHVLTLVQAGRTERVLEVAQQGLQGDGPAVVKLATYLVKLGWSTDKPAAWQTQLAQAGVVALSRLKQINVLTALVVKYRPHPTHVDGFHALWLKGRLAFAEAEKKENAGANFAEAENWFRQALTLPEAKDDPASAAKCEYALAWCEYRRERFADAAPRFEKTAAAFRLLHDAQGVQAAWMAHLAYQALAKATAAPGDIASHRRSLEQLVANFPGTNQAEKAKFLLQKQGGASKTDAATLEKSLLAVTADSPNYLEARFELARLKFEQWKSSSPISTTSTADTLQHLDSYLAAAPPSEANRRTRALLWKLEIVVSDKSPDWTAAQELLDRLARDGHSLEPALTAEVKYRTLQVSQATGRAESLRDAAQWLVEHAAGSAYEVPSLVIWAQHLENAYRKATSTEQSSTRKQLIEVYRKLARQYGDDTTTLKTKKNAFIVQAKLADFEFIEADKADALRRWEKLLAIYPRDANLITKTATAYMELGRPADALDLWNQLVAGTASGSDEWFAAKYHQLECLATVDPPVAAKAWRQFRVLHPRVSSAEWEERFAKLGQARFAEGR